ncbi:putative transcription factor GRF family [Helianthus debilis subsp. tardiflorus]
MVFCHCGRDAIIQTSWTSKNPGRRFYACPVQGSNCPFIGWFDQQRCQRCIDIIPGLLRAKNNLESEKMQLQQQNMNLEEENLKLQQKNMKVEAKSRKLKKYLVFSWICFVMYVLAF